MPYVREGYWRCGYSDPCESAPTLGPRLMLWENLPLRTTRMLGDYAEDLPLPIIFGDLTAQFPLLRLSTTRYFVADHPAEVGKVFIDRQESQAWAASLESDEAGRTWTVVTFAAPIPEGAAISATARGIRDPDTGELIENPAEVAKLIYRIAGRTADWSGLRAECSALDLRIAGRLWETKSIRAHVDADLQSCGAIWCPGMARLYPTSADPLLIIDLDQSEVSDLTATASTADTADVLRLAYDWSDASQKPLHYMEFSASPQRYGGVVKEVVYPYLRTPANAEIVGRAVLQRLAGDRYDVTATSTNRSIRPGMEVRPVDHPEWAIDSADPVITVLTVEIAPDSLSVRVTGETVIGRSLITVTAHSLALPDEVVASVEIEVRDGVATLTVHDDDGRAVPGVRISMDGGAPKTTDAQGKASFPVDVVVDKPVAHVFDFEKEGFVPFSITAPI